MNISRRTLISIASLLGLLVIVVSYVVATAPFKVTDPSDPRFDPMKFNFRDYRGEGLTVSDVFPVLFPPGTPKDLVDKILVEAGGATSRQSELRESQWVYQEPAYYRGINSIKGAPIHVFVFDEHNRVVNIRLGTGSELYPE